ncbi:MULTISPECIES: hypothetical protein [unclassified Neptuniibacter]|uniref:hypothetical protein n=1 Tax=unclassified Neptuniibacter TaxID=2630693 RepID=UPI0025D6E46F|nr:MULTISPECIES: hypothetical protein [unclassified Neptuniibacter]
MNKIYLYAPIVCGFCFMFYGIEIFYTKQFIVPKYGQTVELGANAIPIGGTVFMAGLILTFFSLRVLNNRKDK